MRSSTRTPGIFLWASTAFLILLMPSFRLPGTAAGSGRVAFDGSAPQQQHTPPRAGAHDRGKQSSPRVPGPATLADFAWLEGHWRGDWGPRTAEQVWTAPKGDLMLGTFRLVEGDKTLLIEVFTLLQKLNDIDFRLRHFTPDLGPWEKSGATELTLESFDSTHFVFTNQVNGEPKHAIFTRVGQDTFISRFEIVPASGDMQVVEITYHREKPPRS